MKMFFPNKLENKLSESSFCFFVFLCVWKEMSFPKCKCLQITSTVFLLDCKIPLLGFIAAEKVRTQPFNNA